MGALCTVVQSSPSRARLPPVGTRTKYDIAIVMTKNLSRVTTLVHTIIGPTLSLEDDIVC